jgi:hypothetical protein
MKRSFLLFQRLVVLSFLTCFAANAQVKITDGSSVIMNPNSLPELESSNKGLLVPRISINNINLPAPLSLPVPEGMLALSSGGEYSTHMNGVSSNRTATGVIPSMQGFFVHVTDGSWPVTGALAQNNNVRITDMSHIYNKSAGIVPRSLLRLVAGYTGDSVSFDPLVIYYDSRATYSFDGQFDALKLFNTDSNITNFYVFGDDGSKLSIDGIPFADTLCTFRLGLKTEKNGEITFRIRDRENIFAQKTIVLSDIVAGTNNVLAPGDTFQTYLNAGDYQNRFFLNVGDFLTSIPRISSDNFMFKTYSSNGVIKVEVTQPLSETGILTICSLTGRVLFNQKINIPGFYELRPDLINGIYIVILATANRRLTRKVLFINK